MTIEALGPSRFDRAKLSFLSRVVPTSKMHDLRIDMRPKSGDLVVTRVLDIGHHGRIDLNTGRRTTLFRNDKLVLVYGHRYSPDQFESKVPGDLGPCHIAAAGGLASLVISKRVGMADPTVVEPIGLVVDANGKVLNTLDHALQAENHSKSVPVIAVLGTAMNSGKTTTAASLIYGLKSTGLKVGATKVTGTGGGHDYYRLLDSGAHQVLDFTDAGFPSTYKLAPFAVESVMATLMSRLVSAGSEVVVVEVADGVLQGETAALLQSDTFRNSVDGVLFASRDALGAVAGLRQLEQLDIPVLGVSGICGDSPLAAREARNVLGVSTYSMADLMDPKIASGLLSYESNAVSDCSAV